MIKNPIKIFAYENFCLWKFRTILWVHFGHYFHLPWKQEFTKIWAGRMYPLKTSKHLRFSDSFSGYRKRSIACSGLCKTPFTRLIDFCWSSSNQYLLPLLLSSCLQFTSRTMPLCDWVFLLKTWNTERKKKEEKKARKRYHCSKSTLEESRIVEHFFISGNSDGES